MATIYRNGRAYRYKSIRRDGRVTSEYGGSGEFAALMAEIDAHERDERDQERFEREASEAAWPTLPEAIKAGIVALVKAARGDEA